MRQDAAAAAAAASAGGGGGSGGSGKAEAAQRLSNKSGGGHRVSSADTAPTSAELDEFEEPPSFVKFSVVWLLLLIFAVLLLVHVDGTVTISYLVVSIPLFILYAFPFFFGLFSEFATAFACKCAPTWFEALALAFFYFVALLVVIALPAFQVLLCLKLDGWGSAALHYWMVFLPVFTLPVIFVLASSSYNYLKQQDDENIGVGHNDDVV